MDNAINDEFLTTAELVRLTGYKLPAYQARWLHDNGWTYIHHPNNQIVVSREHSRSMLNPLHVAHTKEDEPNWSPLDGE